MLSIDIDYLVGVEFTQLQSDTTTPHIAQPFIQQIEHYFNNGQHEFTLPLRFSGTTFQQRVWQALQNIKPGQTKTYGELAKALNSSARAIGGACKRNPLPVVIPCHRVVAQQGIGGFAGATSGNNINIKTWLLQHEQ